MATIAYEVLYDNGPVKVIKWQTLTEVNADGQVYFLDDRHSDISVHAFGNFGAGGSIHIQGSNEISSVLSLPRLRDPGGTFIDIQNAGINQVLENCFAIRPIVAAGTGVDIDVYMKITRQEA